MKTENLTSVFNIPEIQDEKEEIDYRKLYEKEKKMRLFYETKTQQLEKQLKNTFKNNHHPQFKRQQKNVHHLMEQIKSFKTLLPNSVKIIPQMESSQSIDEHAPPPLIHEWAIYGLQEQQALSLKEMNKVNASLLASNSDPSQIVQHSSRLVFPSGTSTRTLTGKQALETSLDIINLSKQKLKSFILTFEPTSIQKKIEGIDRDPQLEVIRMLNPERRIYAVCIELEQFTIVKQEECMIQMKTHRITHQKSVKFQDMPSNKDTQGLEIAASKRVYCIFTHYPFFAFFQQLLKSLLYAVKVQRYIRYKQGGQNLKYVDSKPHSMLMKTALEQLRRQSAGKTIVVDKLLDFPVCGNNKAYLQLSRQALTYNLAEQWAYYVLSLFPLDTFLDVLTLLVLQEKIVFVCTNATILTHAIYLFTKVLIKPFEYPYPVVNLIPDQQEYLNAPFPVVYGYLKSPREIIASKIPKKYKNVYVCFEPTGVQIVSQEDKKKVLNKKSPKLRDRLISKFKLMQRNFPSTSFFNFMQKKNEQFQYPVNIELARSIISEVHHYVNNDIHRLLPNDSTVQKIKEQLIAGQSIEEEDINREVFLKIKEEYGPKSKDPFFAAFLETQLLNVHIFKY